MIRKTTININNANKKKLQILDSIIVESKRVIKCSCGLLIDADYNAAINISHMGVYSPHA